MTKRFKATISLLLCAVLVFSMFAACGKQDDNNVDDGETTYGRYVEYDITPPVAEGENMGAPQGFTSFGGGVLEVMMYEYNEDGTFIKQPYTRWRSEDNGATWQELDMSWAAKYNEDYSEYWDNNEQPPYTIGLGLLVPMKSGELIFSTYEYFYDEETGEGTNKSTYYRVDRSGVETPLELETLNDPALEGASYDVYNMKVLPGGRVCYTLQIQPPPEAWDDPSFDYNSLQHTYVSDLETGKTLYELDINGGDFVANDTTIYVYDYEKGFSAVNVADGTSANVELPSEAAQQRIMQMGFWNVFVDNAGAFYNVDPKGMYKYAPGAEDAPPADDSLEGQSGGMAPPSPRSIAMQAPAALMAVAVPGGMGSAPGGANAKGETVMDGLNYSFGSPINSIQGVAYDIETDEIFMSIYESSGMGNGKILRYAWDDEAIATSPNKIKVFSLYENYSIRLGLSEFKRANPDVTIEYETVFSQDSFGGNIVVNNTGETINPYADPNNPAAAGPDLAQTEEDAIRALNTELLNGTGPDVIFLDGIPLDSFIRNGVLADITDIVDANDNLIKTLVDPMRVDGKVYAVPTNFVMPALLGGAGDIQGMTTLDDLVAAVDAGSGVPEYVEFDPNWTPEEQNAYYEKMNGPRNASEQPFIWFTNVHDVFDSLFPSSAPAILSGQNGINQDALASFLQSIKAVSDKYKLAEDGAIAGFGGGGGGMGIGYASYTTTETFYSFTNRRARAGYNLLGSTQILSMAAQNLYWSTQQQYSVAVNDTIDPETGEPVPTEEEPTVEFEDVNAVFMPMPGLSSGVYLPMQVVGVTSTSNRPELAKAFVNAMLGDDVQNHDMGNGFPVTRSGFERTIEEYATETESTWWKEQGYETIPFDYEALVNTLATPYYTNTFLAEAVFKPVMQYCSGQMPLEAAVSQIVNETELYFAERQ